MLDIEAKYGFKKIYKINTRLSKKGILFRDITTLIKDPEAFKFSVDKIIEISKKIKFDKVSAIELEVYFCFSCFILT